MRRNRLRELMDAGEPSIGTRIISQPVDQFSGPPLDGLVIDDDDFYVRIPGAFSQAGQAGLQ